MTTRRAFFLAPLALAPVAGFALWRAGQAEPEGAYGKNAAHGGGLHLSNDPTAPLWRELMKAKRDGGSLTAAMAAASFTPAVGDLDGKSISLRGYMVTLQEAPAHRGFLFAPNPPGCPGCRPSDGFSLLDARGAKPLAASDDPILLTGVLRLRRHDELVYRLEGAVIAG